MFASQLAKRQSALLVACVLGLSVGLPQVFLTTFSQFFEPLEAEFGWSRVQLSSLFSIVTICIAFSTPVFTALINRFGPSPILIVSNVTLAISLSLLALTSHSFGTFLIWTVFIGILGTGTTTFVYLGVLPQWFPRRLGLAFGIAAIGIGIGQAALPLLAQYLIATYDWRMAYVLLSVLVLLVALPGAVGVIRRRPEFSVSTAKSASKDDGLDAVLAARAAWSRLDFWLLTVSFFFIAAVAAGCAVHAMPILLERGMQTNTAAKIVAAGGVSVLISRVVAGYLLDAIGAHFVAMLACLAAILAPLLLTTWSSPSLVLLAPILYGLAVGIEGDLMPFAVRRVFGQIGYATLYGRLFSVFNFGVVAGPVVMGLAYDLTGTYDFVLVGFSILGGVTLPLILRGLGAKRSDEAVISPDYLSG